MKSVLSVRNLYKEFHTDKGKIKAVNGVNFDINSGECVGLIGESGSGKSTVANLIIGIEEKDSGDITFLDTAKMNGKGMNEKLAWNQMNMIFQNPRSSFDSRMRMEECISEGIIYREKVDRFSLSQLVKEKMRTVGLPEAYIKKYAWQLSGGECQRAAIARAIIAQPKFLICDEITSALDVSVQEQILLLLDKLKKETGMSILFITHDLALAGNICDRILVMYQGEIFETGTAMEVLRDPMHPYTQLLLDSVFSINSDRKKQLPNRLLLNSEKSLKNRCKFYNSCRKRTEDCYKNIKMIIPEEKAHQAMCDRNKM